MVMIERSDGLIAHIGEKHMLVLNPQANQKQFGLPYQDIRQRKVSNRSLLVQLPAFGDWSVIRAFTVYIKNFISVLLVRNSCV